MNSTTIIIIIVIIVLLWLIFMKPKNKKVNWNSVPSVDLARYAGIWYEIARLPTPFQDFPQGRCRNSVAQYILNDNGSMSVINTCDLNSREIKSVGIAVPAANTSIVGTTVSPASLNVKFENSPAWGQYNIIYLDQAYQHAMVASTNNQNLWFLARTSNTNPDAYVYMMSIAKKYGFDVNRLISN